MDMKDQKLAKEIAEQRLVVIAPLLDPSLTKADFFVKHREISEQSEISIRTLQRYLDAYNENGMDGLKPKGRVPEKSGAS